MTRTERKHGSLYTQRLTGNEETGRRGTQMNIINKQVNTLHSKTGSKQGKHGHKQEV